MGIYNPGSGGGANPAGSGSELQYRATANTFGAVTGSSVSGGTPTLNENILFTEAIDHTIQINDDTADGSGGNLTVKAGAALTDGDGGNLTLQAGDKAGGGQVGTVIVNGGSDLAGGRGSLVLNGGSGLNKILAGNATLDFPNTLTLTSSDLTIGITGAVTGDPVILGVPNAAIPGAGCSFFAWVSAANVVTVRFVNSSAGSLNPASAVFTVIVVKL